jgi:hypothetical protein
MEKTVMTLKCDTCKHIWKVPFYDVKGNEYNGEDLYQCPMCTGESFGEV